MKRIPFAAVISISMLLAAATARSETDAIGENPGPAWTEAVNGLQCRLLAEKKEHTLGEPLLVDFELRNASNDTLLVYQGYHTEVTTSFDIRDGDGEKVAYRGYISGVGLLYPTVLPGRNNLADRTGYHKCGKSFDLGVEYAIVKPGKYTITATFRAGQPGAVSPAIDAEGIAVWSGTLTSNTIEIDVAALPVEGIVFPDLPALDRTVYKNIKKTCRERWRLDNMKMNTFSITADRDEYLVKCDGFVDEELCRCTIRVDRNGNWINDGRGRKTR